MEAACTGARTALAPRMKALASGSRSRATVGTASTFLKLSSPRLSGNHFYIGRYHDFNQWEYLPHPKLQRSGAILAVGSQKFDPAGKELRGSGLHGPENAEFMRLALWNRLRQRGLRREVPTKEQMRDYVRMDMCIGWIAWAFVLFMYPLGVYGRYYSARHGHHPYAPARTDGSRGEGPFWWFAE